MDLQKKIFATMFAVIAALILVSAGVGLYVAREMKPAQQPQPVSQPTPTETPAEIRSKTFSLKEGGTFALVEGWELVSNTPDRQVDRYRFERKADPQAIFTISVYDKKSIESFSDLITTRYGSAYFNSEQDLQLAGHEAKKVTAEFLNMGMTADMLVKLDQNTYVSLYGIQPGGENEQVKNEINFMQNSFAS